MNEPIRISELSDPRVDVYRDVRDADLRGRDRLFMAESELVVRRLLRTPQRLHSLFLNHVKYERLRTAIESSGATCPIYLADVELMSAIAGFHIHRGALAAGFRPTAAELSIDIALAHLRGRERLTLLLAEGVTNVDNMGGLFRNAAAFGVDGIILDSECCDPLYRKAIRVSIGHTLSVPYAVCESEWAQTVARLRRPLDGDGWGLRVIGAENDDRALPLWAMLRPNRMAIMVGSEAHGLCEATRAGCDMLVRIPMARDVPSLNVATAAAVFLYERSRRLASDQKEEPEIGTPP